MRISAVWIIGLFLVGACLTVTYNKVMADPVEEALQEARKSVPQHDLEVSPGMTEKQDTGAMNQDKPDNQPEETISQSTGNNSSTEDTESSNPAQPSYPGIENRLYAVGAEGEPSVALNYPVVGNKEIDDIFKNFVSELGEAFEKDAREAKQPDDEEPGTYSMWEMSGTYTITKPNPHIISVTFNIYSFMGGAHGDLRVIVMNYDLETGKRIEFANLFGKPDEAVAILSQLTEAKLRKVLGEDVEEDMLKDGTAPEVSNFSNLSLMPNGVAVEFQPYQVGPWSIGQQHIEISLAELKPADPSRSIWPE